MEEFQTDMSETLITLTSDIVAAHVANNNVEVCTGTRMEHFSCWRHNGSLVFEES